MRKVLLSVSVSLVVLAVLATGFRCLFPVQFEQAARAVCEGIGLRLSDERVEGESALIQAHAEVEEFPAFAEGPRSDLQPLSPLPDALRDAEQDVDVGPADAGHEPVQADAVPQRAVRDKAAPDAVKPAGDVASAGSEPAAEARKMTEEAEVGIDAVDVGMLTVALDQLLEEGIPEEEEVVALEQAELVSLAPAEPTRLSGRIVDADGGAGVTGAQISILSTFYKGHLFYDYELREVGKTVADPSGYFSFTYVDAETAVHRQGTGLRLCVSCNGYSTLGAYQLDKITPGKENRLPDIRLSAATLSVSGKVVDQRGSPVAGALVTATGDMHPFRYDKEQRQLVLSNFPHALTNAAGEFRIQNVDRGRHYLSVHVGIDGVGLHEVNVDRDLENHVFLVVLGGRVTGWVRNATGQPVASAIVNGGGNTCKTDTQGRFLLENIPDGPWTLQVLHHAYKQVLVPEVRSGWEDMKIVLNDALPQLLLRVREQSSLHPVPRIEVHFQVTGNNIAGVPLSPVYVSESGQYPILLPEGGLTMTVTAEGFQSAVFDISQITHNESQDLFLVPVVD